MVISKRPLTCSQRLIGFAAKIANSAITTGVALCLWRYAGRILPLGAQAARLAGQMSDAAMAQGRHPGFADVAIAALAQHAGLLLLTCNLRHFQPLGVACADPLIALPAG